MVVILFLNHLRVLITSAGSAIEIAFDQVTAYSFGLPRLFPRYEVPGLIFGVVAIIISKHVTQTFWAIVPIIIGLIALQGIGSLLVLVGGILGIHVWNFLECSEGTFVGTEESWEGAGLAAQVDDIQKALDASLLGWLSYLKKRAEGD